MDNRKTRIAIHRQRGFSLIEMVVVAAIFAAIMIVATESLIGLQKRNAVDSSKVDKTQEARQFLDQIVNDLHQSGFPNSRMYNSANAAVGLVSVTNSAIQFEGDVDGSGNVSEVYIQLVAPANGCPCVVQRGTILKTQVGTGAVPYYTEVDNVMNQNIFSAYFKDGSSVTLPAAATDLPNIKAIGIKLNVRSLVAEENGLYPTITMASAAKIHN